MIHVQFADASKTAIIAEYSCPQPDIEWQGEVEESDPRYLEFLSPRVALVVSPRQIRQALTQAGMRDDVEAAVSAGDRDIRDWWEFSATIEEDHAEVVAMCERLGVSAEQRHAIFLAASAL